MGKLTGETCCSHRGSDDWYDEKNILERRQRVHRLYYQNGLSKTEIARREHLGKKFVMRWTESEDQDLTADARGWPKGVARSWDEKTEQRIVRLHGQICRDPHEFFSGATAIAQRYSKTYSGPVPSLRTIGRILKAQGLSGARKKPRAKGAAAYLCYPEHTVYTSLGARLLEVDFIGKKFITGRSAPLNFLGFSFKKEPRLRYFKRFDAQTADATISGCLRFFSEIEKPHLVKVDNCAATIGSTSGKRLLSKFMHAMLTQQVIPVFSVPRKPFSQGSIEGNNSVFARKFWNTRTFTSVRQIDRQLEWFNTSSRNYCRYDPPKKPRGILKRFRPKVYFIRQVREDAETGRGIIDVLNEEISLPKRYIQYFVLAEWDIRRGQLIIWFEKEQTAKPIKTVSFVLNPNSSYSI